MGYPDFENFAYMFGRAELKLGPDIFTAVTNVSFDQPTTEGEVRGTKPWPLARTEGTMAMGAGTVTFSDEAERAKFLKKLGPGYRSKIWKLNWTLVSPGRDPVKMTCIGCRVLANPVAHGEGTDALGGDVAFSFGSHLINGMPPHRGMPAG